MDIANLNHAHACEVLRKGIIENDLSLKEAATKIHRSIGTVKRALHGSMGDRTVFQILKQFDPE